MVSPLICEVCDEASGRYDNYVLDRTSDGAKKWIGHVFTVCHPHGILEKDCVVKLIGLVRQKFGPEAHVSLLEKGSWLTPGAHNPDHW